MSEMIWSQISMLMAVVAFSPVVRVLVREILKEISINANRMSERSAKELGPSVGQFAAHLSRIRLRQGTAQLPGAITQTNTTLQRHMDMATSTTEFIQPPHLRNIGQKASTLAMERGVK